MSLLIANTNGQAAAGLVQTTAVGAPNIRAAHTICCRIRFTSTPTNIDVVPVAFTSDTTLSGSWLERRNGDAAGAFWAKRWNAGQTLNDQASIGSYSTSWHHFAMTYDATNIRTYLDGVLVATTASATTRTDTSTNNRIFIGFGGQYVIADVGFFSRALNADELLYLTGNRLGIVLSKGDCFGWYPLLFDRFRKDYSGRGNDLDDFAGTGTAPAADNEDPGELWATDYSRVFQVLTSTVAAAGDGRTVFNGSGAQTSAVAESADGRTVFNGSGARTVAVAESADGRTLFNGSGARTVAVAPTADGRTLFNGSGTASTSGDINATGDGRTAFNGAGTLTAAAVGVADGRTVFNGSASATVAVSTSGDGRTLFNGSGDTQVQLPALPPQARGSGRRTTWIWTNPITPPTYESVLGDKLVEYWHSEQGISLDGFSHVQAWTGRVRGLVMDQPTSGFRPIYATDGALFAGKNVVKCDAATACLAYVPGATIFEPGERPGLVYISRYRTVPGAAAATMINVGAGGNNDLYDGTAVTTGIRRKIVRTLAAGGGRTITEGLATTDVQMLSIGLSPSEFQVWRAGQLAAKSPSFDNLNEPWVHLAIGAFNQAGTQPAAVNFAMVFLCRVMPNQFEQLQLYELAKVEWGI